MVAAPHLWLNGRVLAGHVAADAPVLAPVEITWGAASAYDHPDPDSMKFELLFKENMFDIPDLTKGSDVELVHPVGNRTIFAGKIRTMSAVSSTRFRGGLEVTVNATGHRRDFDEEYISTDWGNSFNVPGHLRAAAASIGWALELADNPLESAGAKYNSIKLFTMIQRHIARYRGRAFETSFRDSAGDLYKRITVMEGTAREVAPDKLTTTANGQWIKQYTTPLIGDQPSLFLDLPADNVLRDPSWSQDPENAITAANVSTMAPGDDGFTTLTERRVLASAALRNQFGTQAVDFETDLLNEADWRAAANRWMTTDSPWTMDGLTIHDEDLLTEQELADLLASDTRFKTLVAVTGILPNRPDPGPSDLRSYLLGGTYTWTGKKWNMVLLLERTITALTGAGDFWTCTNVGTSTRPLIANATCASVGDNLTVSDFLFIGAP